MQQSFCEILCELKANEDKHFDKPLSKSRPSERDHEEPGNCAPMLLVPSGSELLDGLRLKIEVHADGINISMNVVHIL
ncbi:hypothetical protein KC19_N031700 [Ceratodon purpureus]|nr:hypothetical protein KC19_N031700 [Ceratodon purpureus]